MPFSIVAELPLGMYRGHTKDGSTESFPSVARLHAALLSAAALGPRAVLEDEETMSPCAADEVALRWLEENPPDGVRIPSLEVNVVGRQGTAYRDDGTIKIDKKGGRTKKLAKEPCYGIAVAEPFVWRWSAVPPPEVLATLNELCREVAYLGTTESPVRLRVSDEDHVVDHQLDPDPSKMYAAGAQLVDVPAAGRMERLRSNYQQRLTEPSTARDKFRTDEASQTADRPDSEHVTRAVFMPVTPVTATAPWSRCLLIPFSGTLRDVDHVRAGVAVHRALVKAIAADGPVPPEVSGVYPPGQTKSANQVAVQIVSPDMVAVDDRVSWRNAIALLIPRTVDHDVRSQILAAVARLRRIDLYRDRWLSLWWKQDPLQLEGDRFWRPPTPGRVRFWRTQTAAVPDTRGATKDWTFVEAALLSTGFVFKDDLPAVAGRGAVRDQALLSLVAARGVRALYAQPLRTSRPGVYAHHVNAHAVVRPYQAVLHLGDLTRARTVVAIGQSRHLGGGLLVPHDVLPQDVLVQGERA